MPHTKPRPIVDRHRWQRVIRYADSLGESGEIPGLAFGLVHGGRTTGTVCRGQTGLDAAAPPVNEETIFLIASLTKPVVAMATLLLIERGQLALADRAVDFVPEFGAAEKRPITIRHLLTHTSGLPDMLPNNRALRSSCSPLESFVSGTCGVSLDFPPGRGVQYQSMGFALLSEIIKQVSGVSCSEFVQRELFNPLGMKDTALGTPPDWWEPDGDDPPKVSRIAEIRVPPEQQDGDDWNWNSRYWRSLGAPWGGMLSTAHDLLVFCRMMLSGGVYGNERLFSQATVSAATSNQLDCQKDLPEADRRTRGWGFGWRLNWTSHVSSFSDLLSPTAYGHWGATGTLFWIDPARDAAAVLLSTQPLPSMGALGSSHLTRLSNLIAAAL
ncbi:MAG: class A beta-lactamase-related serine hydrolase [Planctomycetota bacterium]|nr:MAG: class A beta-lactamase-related serine hydrolase [Planctomycetota bacterium]REK19983.1 MAG: class A beta-lactamase-related serine hydrolase [Planctomycetota bacterium]REK27550.1 MAG: class A beta-lactamase-related serine hydrolase [Planctomycetota bacterium]